MNTLDERILIPAPAAVVWEHISDLARNPTWHVDCSNISFLTTFHKGQDVRWRYSGKSRHDYVVQVTAWYEGLGYEYTYIDGVPYRQNKGRIRLQEIPEGTIVQWTFSYELGGALSGLRDAIGYKRSVNTRLIDSLKKLWLYMKHADRGNIAREPKSLMRDAPDVEARAQYKPRHPSAVMEPQLQQPSAPLSLFAEPPSADDDTRPRPAVKVDFAPPQPEPAKEPDFLSAMRSTQDMMPVVTKEEPLTSTTPAAPVPIPHSPAEKPIDAADVDTAKVSIFELFGLPKPSETQEMRTVTSTSLSPIIDKPMIVSLATHERRGIRILMRRRIVKIRRP